jgi:tetratricopeptide (TPR) repeat protein
MIYESDHLIQVEVECPFPSQGFVARTLVECLSKRYQSSPLENEHAPMLRDLWVGTRDEIKPSMMEKTKWERPFRFYPKDHLINVVIDGAYFVHRLLKDQNKTFLLVITGANYLDDQSIRFIEALLRMEPCYVMLIYFKPCPFKLTCEGPLVKGKLLTVESNSGLEQFSTFHQKVNGQPLTGLERRKNLSALIQEARNKQEPQELLSILSEASFEYANGGYYKEALQYAVEGIELAKKLNQTQSHIFYRLLHTKYLCEVTHYKGKEASETAGQQFEVACSLNDHVKIANAGYNLAMNELRVNKNPRQALLHLCQTSHLLEDEIQNIKVAFVYAFCLNAKAFAYFQLRQAEKAKDYLNQAKKILEPFLDHDHIRMEQATFCYNFSQLLVAENNVEEAIEWIKQARELEPDFSIYQIEHANYLCHLTRYEDAISLYQSAKKMGVPSPELLIGLANAQYMMGDLTSSLETLIELRMKFPERIEGFVDSAMIYLDHLGEPEKAKHLLLQGESYQSKHPLYLFQLGRAYHELGETELAKCHIQKAITIDMECKEAWIELATLYFEEEDINGALTAINQAIKLDPDNPIAINNRRIFEEYIRERDCHD